MTEKEVLQAMCCMAGGDSDVTIDELSVLGAIALRAGIQQPNFIALMERSRDDPVYAQEQNDELMEHAEASLNILIRLARETGSLSDGHLVMLLWRIAGKLDVHAEKFEKLVAAGTTG